MGLERVNDIDTKRTGSRVPCRVDTPLTNMLFAGQVNWKARHTYPRNNGKRGTVMWEAASEEEVMSIKKKGAEKHLLRAELVLGANRKPNWARKMARHIEHVSRIRTEGGSLASEHGVIAQLNSRLSVQADSLMVHNPEEVSVWRTLVDGYTRFWRDRGFTNKTRNVGEDGKVLGDPEIFAGLVVDMVGVDFDPQDIASFFGSMKGVASLDPNVLKYFLSSEGLMDQLHPGVGMMSIAEARRKLNQETTTDQGGNGLIDFEEARDRYVNERRRVHTSPSTRRWMVEMYGPEFALPNLEGTNLNETGGVSIGAEVLLKRQAQLIGVSAGALDHAYVFANRTAELLNKWIDNDGELTEVQKDGMKIVARAAKETAGYLSLMRLGGYQETIPRKPISEDRAKVPIAGAIVDAVTIHSQKTDAELADMLISCLRRRKVETADYKNLLAGFVMSGAEIAEIVDVTPEEIVRSRDKMLIYVAIRTYLGTVGIEETAEQIDDSILIELTNRENEKVHPSVRETVVDIIRRQGEDIVEDVVLEVLEGVEPRVLLENNLVIASSLMVEKGDNTEALNRISMGVIPEVIAQLRERRMEHPGDMWTLSDYEELGIADQWESHTDRVSRRDGTILPGVEAVRSGSVILEFSTQLGNHHVAHEEQIRGALRLTKEDLLLAGIVGEDFDGDIVVALRINSGNPHKKDEVDVCVRHKIANELLKDAVTGDKYKNQLIIYPPGESDNLTTAERMRFNYDRYVKEGRSPYVHVRIMGSGKLPYSDLDMELNNMSHILTVKADQMNTGRVFEVAEGIMNNFDEQGAIIVYWGLSVDRSTHIRDGIHGVSIAPKEFFVMVHPALVPDLFGPGKERWSDGFRSWEEYLVAWAEKNSLDKDQVLSQFTQVKQA